MAKTMVSCQAFPSLPSSSRAPRVSLVPKIPFLFPFKRLPRRLTFYWIIGIIGDYRKKNLRELLLSKKKANHSGKIKRELGEGVTLMCGFSKDQ